MENYFRIVSNISIHILQLVAIKSKDYSPQEIQECVESRNEQLDQLKALWGVVQANHGDRPQLTPQNAPTGTNPFLR